MSLVEGPIPLRNILRMADKNKSGPSNRTSSLAGNSIPDPKTTSNEQRLTGSTSGGGQNEVVVAQGGGGGRKIGLANLICSNSVDTGHTIANLPLVKARKSSFQITRVIDSNAVADTDSMDDIDETTNTEQDTSSDNRDISRTTVDSSSDHEDTVTTTLDTMRSPSPGHDELESPVKGDGRRIGRLSDKGKRPDVDQSVISRVSSETAIVSPSGLSVNSSPTTAEPQKSKAQTFTPQSDIQSRFKIVKIISNVRGRWKCLDFSGLPANETTSSDSKSNTALSSRSASAVDVSHCSNPVFYVTNNASTATNPLETLVCGAYGRLVQFEANPSFQDISELVAALPGQIATNINMHQSASGSNQIITSISETGSGLPNMALLGGVVIPSSSLLISSQTANENTFGNILTSNRSRSDPAFLVAEEGLSGGAVVVPVLQPTNDPGVRLNDTDAMFEDNVDAASDYADSSGSNCALDNKIEQAMDLVKSHLMFAVHEEVELLKEQIKELTIKNTQLEAENNLLRAAATTETLAKLDLLPPSISRPDST